MILSLKVPIRIQSESNLREHWTKKHKRQKKQKLVLRQYLMTLEKPSLPVEITLVRIAPRQIDVDNMWSGVKIAIDTIADWLIPGHMPGIADGDRRLTFRVEQKKGDPKEYALKIFFKYEKSS